MRLPEFLLALALAANVALLRAAVVEPTTVTSFERRPGEIVVAVKLNGQGPFQFLLDTGSTHTALSPRTATVIAAPVVATAVMGSAAGSRDTLVVRVDALQVGPVEVAGLLASIVELGGISDGSRIDGVLGQDALASLRYTIDFEQRRVVWWPGDALLGRGHSFDLQQSHGRFLIVLPQRQSLLRLVPDTGAESLLLFDPNRALPVTQTKAFATLTTTSGSTTVRLGTLRELLVGGLTLRDVPAVVAERDDSEPAEIDGLLPLHLFDRVTVDGRQRRLIVEKTRRNDRLMFF